MMIEKPYKVINLIDHTYQVIDNINVDDWHEGVEPKIHYQGSLADCEAWIRLDRGGYF